MSPAAFPTTAEPEQSLRAGSGGDGRWVALGAVWILLLGWSLLRVPTPGINEPHYLGKARHFWDSSWCAGDLFLESSNPHAVFYATFGWTTLWLTLPQAALLGRAIGLLFVAVGWQALCRPLLGGGLSSEKPISSSPWGGVLAACFFLLLHALGNWSGEWLVGGVESRLFAYGLLFWGWGQLLEGRVLPGAAALGLAVSFHPVIGAWGVLATLAAGLWILWSVQNRDLLRQAVVSLRTSGAIALGVGLICALPGLICATQAIGTPDQATAVFIDQLQVGDRLRHHLDPMAIPVTAYRYFGLQIVLGLLLTRGLEWTRERRFWGAVVCACLLFAAVGFLVGCGERPVQLMPGWTWRIRLLKFYPFRLADIIVPVTVSILAAENWRRNWNATVVHQRALPWAGVAALFLAFVIPYADAEPSRLQTKERIALEEAYAWLKQNSAPTDLCQALDVDWGLRWFAERPQFVSYKDMPQDAASLLTWNDRLWTVFRWKTATERDAIISREELAELGRLTGIRYLVLRKRLPGTSHTRTFPTTAAFENVHFRIELLIPDSSSGTGKF